MKNMIVVAKKDGENKELLAIQNADKIKMAKIVKVSSAIDLGSKYSWAINNVDMNTAGDLGLISIKKY